MPFCDTYISVFCSAIIRDTSSCNGWQQIQRPTASQHEWMRNLATASTWMEYFHQIPLLRSQETLGEGRTWKSWKGWSTPRKQSLLCTTEEHKHTCKLTETRGSMHNACLGLHQIDTTLAFLLLNLFRGGCFVSVEIATYGSCHEKII